jgi:chromosome segregation ATPase
MAGTTTPSLMFIVFVAAAIHASATRTHHMRAEAQSGANPIRRVVTMLQDMQRKVQEEGEKESELYDKFMCYCKTNGGTLDQSIAEAKAKIDSLTSELEATSKRKVQTDQSLVDNRASREGAKGDMSKATEIRTKEAAAFSKEAADLKTNLEALAKAIPAIENGMSSSFLQTAVGATLRTLVVEKAELPDNQRQDVMAFLSGSGAAGYVPRSGEIVGILKNIEDQMKKSLAEATSTEEESQQSYDGLMAGKKKEVGALSSRIESELARSGQLGVDISSMSNDLEDTKQSLAGDTQFLAELQTGCDTKTKEWEVIKQTRAEELVALADTIRVLNDDDALELFKKTLPSASSSFTQIMSSTATVRAAALNAIQGTKDERPQFNLIMLALKGKKIGFEKVIKMIDEMSLNLKAEQKDDDAKKEYCNAAFDTSDDKKKALELSVKDSNTAIDTLKGSIDALKSELAALQADIKALDKSVAEATDLRKTEHQDYEELMTSNTHAKELLLWAKNRLNKFYNPKMYKAPPKRELSGEERITENFGGIVPTEAPGGIADTGIGASFAQVHSQKQHEAVPPPPETFGAYTKKSGQNTGVMAMMDLLIKDLDKEMTEADVTEKDSQKEYQSMMADASKKRADDSKSVTDKEAAKANAEEALEAEQDRKASTTKELAGTLEYIHGLHLECDWLLQYYDARKAARAGEVESLVKAKAVLSGADYSLLEKVHSERRGNLRAVSA